MHMTIKAYVIKIAYEITTYRFTLVVPNLVFTSHYFSCSEYTVFFYEDYLVR